MPAIDDVRQSDALFASYVGFSFLAWYLNGLGAVLPSLREEIGQGAGLYALLPGAALFTWGLITVTRPRREHSHSGRTPGIAVGFVVLALAIVVMGITGWPAVSVFGAVVAAVAAAHVNRVLPGMLATTTTGRRVESAMMRANAFSSVAAISAPLVVGASLALGAGWLTGFVVPIAIAALLVVWTARRSPPTAPVDKQGDRAPLPPFRDWWRECAVLSVSIVVEFCFAYFAATYLTEERGMSKAAAAAGGAAWGVGMAIGRFGFSVRAPPRSILPSAVTILVGFALFWCIPNSVSSIVGIGVAGLGASPLYPSRITILMDRFPGAAHEGSKRGALAAGSALLMAPALMVSLRAVSDVRMAYLAVPVLLIVLVVLATPRHAPQPARV